MSGNSGGWTQGDLFSESELDELSGRIPDYSCLHSVENARSDGDKMIDAQYRFRNGEKEALADFYAAAVHAGENFAWQMRARDKTLRRYAQAEMKMLVHEAAADVIIRLMENRFFVMTKPAAYIYKRVRTKLKPYKRELERMTVDMDISDLKDI